MLESVSPQARAQDSAKGVRWDLSSLYAGPDDPRLSEDNAKARTLSTAFVERWKGRVAQLSPAEAGAMLEEYEAGTLVQWRIATWTSLAYSVDSQNPAILSAQAEARKLFSDLEAECSFLSVEISALEDDVVAAWWSDPKASRLRHWIEDVRKYRKHILSEPEERLASRKDLTGRSAASQLFDDLTNSLVFPFDDGTGLRDRTGAEMLAYNRSADPALRKASHEAFLGMYEKNGLVLSHVFNTLCQDHQIDNEIRRYDHPMQRTHMQNSLSTETVDTMMRVVHESYPVAQRFWRAKAKLLGMPKLTNTDIYAPISTLEKPLSWPEAVDTVLSAYDDFSPELGRLARQFHEKGWIDAEVRAGKEDGAFCSGSWPDHHPYVLLNYTGLLRDVYTLAHELGHGVHYCRSAKQPVFLYDAPLVLAETASVFGEQLLTLKLLEKESDPELRRSLLCGRIEDALSTAFRQNVLTEFELSAHLARRDGLLSKEKICDLWWKANADLYGDAVEMNPAYRWGWSYIPHFIHTRFYCYAYTFGLLLVLGLYQRWREEGDSFVPRYMELLAKGGSEDPAKACEAVGIKLDEDFWRAGNRAIEALVAEFEALV